MCLVSNKNVKPLLKNTILFKSNVMISLYIIYLFTHSVYMLSYFSYDDHLLTRNYFFESEKTSLQKKSLVRKFHNNDFTFNRNL